MENRDYKRASVYYLVGNLFNKGISFLTVPIFTRILSTSDYGVVNTYNSWVAILYMFMGLAIYMCIRSAYVDYPDKISAFMSSATSFTLINGILVCFIVLVSSSIFKVSFGLNLIILCVIQSLAQALNENYMMYLMMKYDYKKRTALMVLPNAIAITIAIFLIIKVLNSDLYMGRIVPGTVITAITAIITTSAVFRRGGVHCNKEYINYGLKISVPLVLHGVALSILSQSDRIMITSISGASQTGIYSLIYNFGMIATVITTSLDGVWVPWFYGQMTEERYEDINKKAIEYVYFMTAAMSVVILVGPEVVHILADEKYWEGIVIIPAVVISNYIIFVYTLYVNIEHYYKKTTFITINTLIAAGSNIVLNAIFIPMYGYVAAAYTTLASYIISMVLHAVRAKKLQADLYPITMFIVPILELLVFTVIFYFCVDMPVIRWAIAVAYGIYLVIKYKEEIKRIVFTK